MRGLCIGSKILVSILYPEMGPGTGGGGRGGGGRIGGEGEGEERKGGIGD